MTAQLKVLLVDDDEDDQLITRRLLQKAFGNDALLDVASTWEGAAAEILREQHDVYLIDYSLGERNGINCSSRLPMGR